ncbi:MAG: exodeoxyribonuclease I [Rudaea sp.]
MRAASFFWHDYETTGTDPRRDRPAQFAGQRTTLDLEPVDDPVSLYCRPAPDVLPIPQACLITGITPQIAEREGVIEAEFAAQMHEQLAAPGTCGVGYNSIRFDDEFTRNLLYRNFYDPYEREWKDGNSRWDIIDLARMCYALRPAGIEWPLRDDGMPSFRLQDLAVANHLTHTHAHDALSDVQATIALARLLKRTQPRLWDFHLGLRRKAEAFRYLDYVHRTPVLHVSVRFPAERGCLAMVVPLALHPQQPNKVIVYDLDADPAPLLELAAEEIADRVFTPRADLPENIARIPLKAVAANKSPALAPLSVLKGVNVQRIHLDVARCETHLERLRSAPNLADKLRAVFATQDGVAAATDPELAIYDGFASDVDKRLFNEVRRTPPAQLGTRNFGFRDARFTELLFRYRARNFPATLSAGERTRWDDFRRTRLTQSTPLTILTLDQYLAEIATLRAEPAMTGAQQIVLDQLEAWDHKITNEIADTASAP